MVIECQTVGMSRDRFRFWPSHHPLSKEAHFIRRRTWLLVAHTTYGSAHVEKAADFPSLETRYLRKESAVILITADTSPFS